MNLLVGFFVVFAVIGATELVDRTNFALVGLAARNPPFAVWSGAAVAFVATTALAVAIGSALLVALHGQVIYLRLGGGAVLLAYAAYLAWVPETQRRYPAESTGFRTALSLILLLELGDTTMIFTIVFLSTIPNPLLVGTAAASALVLVAALATLVGSRLARHIEPGRLDRLVVVILVLVGIVTIVYALDPALFAFVPG